MKTILCNILKVIAMAPFIVALTLIPWTAFAGLVVMLSMVYTIWLLLGVDF